MHSTSSASTEKVKYPTWLKELFIFFTVTYQHLWTDRLAIEEMAQATFALWHHALAEFKPAHIMQAALDLSKRLNYPPTPKDLLEAVKFIRDREKDNELFRITDEKRLLSAPPPTPVAESVLEAKIEMWMKLGRIDKVKILEAELAQRKMDCKKT